MKKLIRYRIAVSRTFPATHKRAGEPTYFVEKIINTINGWNNDYIQSLPLIQLVDETKPHTIRGNYPLWEKRFEKIMKGEAVLELYYWSGKPYNSKCVTICQLGKDDGVGIQELKEGIICDCGIGGNGMYVESDLYAIAKNDGLCPDDFKEWFKNYDPSESMAIIHFTSFRY